MLCLGELPGVNVDYWNTLGKRPEPRPASGSRGRPGGLAATQPLPGAAHPTSPRGPRRPSKPASRTPRRRKTFETFSDLAVARVSASGLDRLGRSPDARGRRPSWAARGVTQQHRVLRTLSPTQRTQRRRSVPATIERAASLGEVLRAPVYEAAQVAFEESYDVESLTTQQLLAPEKDDWHDDESEIDCRAPKPRTGRALWDLVLSRGGRQRSSSRASLRSLLNAAAEPGATARAARPASHGDARTLALLSRISATKALQLPHCLAPSGAHALTTALRAPWTKTLVSQIRVVDLRHNGLAAAGLGDLVCVVLENAFELKTLDLSGNVVGGDPSPFVQKRPSTAPQSRRTEALGGAPMITTHSHQVAKGPPLRLLDSIAKYLQNASCNLVVLQLQGASVDDASKVATALFVNRSLRFLNLSENALSAFLAGIATKLGGIATEPSALLPESPLENETVRLIQGAVRSAFSKSELVSGTNCKTAPKPLKLKGLSPLLVDRRAMHRHEKARLLRAAVFAPPTPAPSRPASASPRPGQRTHFPAATNVDVGAPLEAEPVAEPHMTLTSAVKRVLLLVSAQAAACLERKSPFHDELATLVSSGHVSAAPGSGAKRPRASAFRAPSAVKKSAPSARERRQQDDIVTLFRMASFFQQSGAGRRHMATGDRRAWQLVEILGVGDSVARLYSPLIGDAYVSILRCLFGLNGVSQALGVEENGDVKAVDVPLSDALDAITGGDAVDDFPAGEKWTNGFFISLASNEELDDLVVGVRGLRRGIVAVVDFDDLMEAVLAAVFKWAARAVNETQALLQDSLAKKDSSNFSTSSTTAIELFPWADFYNDCLNLFDHASLDHVDVSRLYRDGVVGRPLVMDATDEASMDEELHNLHHTASPAPGAPLESRECVVARLAMALWRAGLYRKKRPSLTKRIASQSAAEALQSAAEARRAAKEAKRAAGPKAWEDDDAWTDGGPPMILTVQSVDALRLTCLDVSSNRFKRIDEAAVVLACAPMLVTFRLAHNRLGDEGAVALATVLDAAFVKRGELFLEHLDVSSCDVGARGCLALAEVLAMRHVSKSLDVSSNPVGDIGGRALLRAATTECAAVAVVLRNCTFGKSAQGVSESKADPPALAFSDPEWCGFPEYILDLSDYEQRCAALRAIRLVQRTHGCTFSTLKWRVLVGRNDAVLKVKPPFNASPLKRQSRSSLTSLCSAADKWANVRLTRDDVGELVDGDGVWAPPRFDSAKVQVPRSGEVHLAVKCDAKLPTKLGCLGEVGLRHLEDLLRAHGGDEAIFKLALRDARCTAEQAVAVISAVYRPRGPAAGARSDSGLSQGERSHGQAGQAFRCLVNNQPCANSNAVRTPQIERAVVHALPRIVDRSNASAFVRALLPAAETGALLRSAHGAAYPILVGEPSGRYVLQLGRSNDRLALRLLLELDDAEAFELSARRQQLADADVPSNFRNVSIKRAPPSPSDGAAAAPPSANDAERPGGVILSTRRASRTFLLSRLAQAVRRSTVPGPSARGYDCITLDWASTRRPELGKLSLKPREVIDLGDRSGFASPNPDMRLAFANDASAVFKHCEDVLRHAARAMHLDGQERYSESFRDLFQPRPRPDWLADPQQCAAQTFQRTWRRWLAKHAAKVLSQPLPVAQSGRNHLSLAGLYVPQPPAPQQPATPSTAGKRRGTPTAAVVAAVAAVSTAEPPAPAEAAADEDAADAAPAATPVPAPPPTAAALTYKRAKVRGLDVLPPGASPGAAPDAPAAPAAPVAPVKKKKGEKKKKKKKKKAVAAPKVLAVERVLVTEDSEAEAFEDALDELRLHLPRTALDCASAVYLVALYGNGGYFCGDGLKTADTQRTARLVVALLPHIVDVDCVSHKLLCHLSASATRQVLHRVGILQCMSPLEAAAPLLEAGAPPSEAGAPLEAAPPGTGLRCGLARVRLDLRDTEHRCVAAVAATLLRAEGASRLVCAFHAPLRGAAEFDPGWAASPESLASEWSDGVALGKDNGEVCFQGYAGSPLGRSAILMRALVKRHLFVSGAFRTFRPLEHGQVLRQLATSPHSQDSQDDSARDRPRSATRRVSRVSRSSFDRRSSFDGRSVDRGRRADNVQMPAADAERLGGLVAHLERLRLLELRSRVSALRRVRQIYADRDEFEEASPPADFFASDFRARVFSSSAVVDSAHERLFPQGVVDQGAIDRCSRCVISLLCDFVEHAARGGAVSLVSFAACWHACQTQAPCTSTELVSFFRAFADGAPDDTLRNAVRNALGERGRRIAQVAALFGVSPREKARLYAPLIGAVYALVFGRLGQSSKCRAEEAVPTCTSAEAVFAVTGAGPSDASCADAVHCDSPATWINADLLRISTDARLLSLLRRLRLIARRDRGRIAVDDVLEVLLDFLFEAASKVQQTLQRELFAAGLAGDGRSDGGKRVPPTPAQHARTFDVFARFCNARAPLSPGAAADLYADALCGRAGAADAATALWSAGVFTAQSRTAPKVR